MTIPTSEPFTDLGLDSLNVYNVFVEPQAQNGIQVPDRDFEKVRTIDSLRACLAERES